MDIIESAQARARMRYNAIRFAEAAAPPPFQFLAEPETIDASPIAVDAANTTGGEAQALPIVVDADPPASPALEVQLPPPPGAEPVPTSAEGSEESLSPPPGAKPVPTFAEGGERHTIFTPRAQGEFLKSLQFNGNVRLACRAARVSAQTAYRARRRSPGLARAWDAALLAARDQAEQVLADRALNGVEEAVFYHGEEVARRRRYDSRLLLAHLARLDKLAERPELLAALRLLDGHIEGLGEGVPIPDPAPAPELSQDPVPCVPSCRVSPQADANAAGQTRTPSSSEAVGQQVCPDCGGQCDTPGAKLGPADCQWLGNRIGRMLDARPEGADTPYQLAQFCDADAATIEELQLEAFEADGHEWWLVTTHEAMMASILHGEAAEEGEGAGGVGD